MAAASCLAWLTSCGLRCHWKTATSPREAPAAPKTSRYHRPPSEAAKVVAESKASFREAALEKGVHTVAIDALVAIVNDKLGGDFEKGLGVLASKSAGRTQRQVRPQRGVDTSEQW